MLCCNCKTYNVVIMAVAPGMDASHICTCELSVQHGCFHRMQSDCLQGEGRGLREALPATFRGGRRGCRLQVEPLGGRHHRAASAHEQHLLSSVVDDVLRAMPSDVDEWNVSAPAILSCKSFGGELAQLGQLKLLRPRYGNTVKPQSQECAMNSVRTELKSIESQDNPVNYCV